MSVLFCQMHIFTYLTIKKKKLSIAKFKTILYKNYIIW